MPEEEEASSLSIDDVTLFYKRFMRPIGILRFDSPAASWTLQLGRLLVFVCFLCSSLIHWSMLLVHAVNTIRQDKVPTIDEICETVLACGVDARYYLLIGRRLQFGRLLAECEAIWAACREADRRAVRRFEAKIRPLFKFILGSTLLNTVVYAASAALMTANSRTSERHLPYKWYTENGSDLWPGYEVNFAVQVLAIFNEAAIVATVDSACPLLVMMAAGYFRALRQRLSRIAEYDHHGDDDPSILDSELLACVRLHQRIHKFGWSLEKFGRTLFFVQLLCTTYVISLVGIKLISTDPDRYKYIALMCINFGELFICQWAPDHLLNESLAISTAAFAGAPIWMRRRMGRVLLMVIARSHKPVQLTAAGAFNLSIEKFGSMLTSAVSFFTMLRNYNVR